MSKPPSNSKLVWSDDPKDKLKVEDKRANPEFKKSAQVTSPTGGQATGQSTVTSTNWVAIFRIEKSGRGGKTVTVLDGLPKQEIFLRDLCKELKNKCGTGGTYSTEGREGLIEIQGDKREAIKAIFDKKGYKYKGM